MEFTAAASLAHSSHSPSEEISRILNGEFAEVRGVGVGARVKVPAPKDGSKLLEGVSSAPLWRAQRHGWQFGLFADGALHWTSALRERRVGGR